MPWRKVEENVVLPQELQATNCSSATERVIEMLDQAVLDDEGVA